MSFNLKTAGTLLSRAKQFTEEKLGQATERTEYDENFANLLTSADQTKYWTEQLISHVERVLQPNPNERLEDFISTKLDQKETNKLNVIEKLGKDMNEAGNNFGSSTQYGSTLIKCGQAHQKLGQNYKDFIQSAVVSYIQPLRRFLEGEMKSISKERSSLDTKRLDLDAAKTKQKRIQSADADVRNAQAEFERQYDITRSTLDYLKTSQNHHLSCLSALIESELQYYKKSVQILEDLQKTIGLSESMSNAATTTTTSH